MAGAGALHVSRAAKDTYNRCGTWDSRHFHPATAILLTRLGQRRTRSRPRLSCGRLPDEEWEQDATMKATLHERDADHDELLRRVQVQPDDVADQRRPQALEFLRRDRSVPGIQPYLVQNLGIHWTPSGPATDPGLVDDRGRRVNAPESPAHPQRGKSGCPVRSRVGHDRQPAQD